MRVSFRVNLGLCLAIYIWIDTFLKFTRRSRNLIISQVKIGGIPTRTIVVRSSPSTVNLTSAFIFVHISCHNHDAADKLVLFILSCGFTWTKINETVQICCYVQSRASSHMSPLTECDCTQTHYERTLNRMVPSLCRLTTLGGHFRRRRLKSQGLYMGLEKFPKVP